MSAPLAPFRVGPLFKPKVWAGERLADLGWREKPPAGTGEVWLVSDLPDAASPVLEGPFAGASLRDVIAGRPRELLGADAEEGQFPLLVKILDVGPPLSVQVHPDATVARELGDGERGKCEAWLILAAEDDGAMLFGLQAGVRPSDVPRRSRDGTLTEVMHTFAPRIGEGVEIVPGTLHTAHGLLALEVQEASDITYRVYDYGRQRGELHLAQAQRCLELTSGVRAPQRGPGWADGWRPERRPLAPQSPFEFTAMQLEAGETLDLSATGGARIVVILEGQLDAAGLELQPIDALVLPACWSGSAIARSPVRLGYAAAGA